MSHRAFTLLEIIFVIILIGILGSIGSEIIFKAYENYLISKNLSKVAFKLDVALLQIQRRLMHRVKFSEVVRDNNDNLDTLSRHSSSNFNHVEWIGEEYEARRGEYNGSMYFPGWSGIADLNLSNKQKLVSPGSHLSYATNIIKRLHNKDLTKPHNGCAIIFYNSYIGTPLSAFGWDGSDPNAAFTIHKDQNHENIFLFDNQDKEKDASDIYTLTCSAYALKHDENNNLVFYYDYRPWLHETYHDGKHVILVDHVSTFQIRRRSQAIEIRLCIDDNTTIPIEMCGKKVIF